MPEELPEVWLRGPLDNIPLLLQPVAHALLQAQEEIHQLTKDLSDDNLWKRPAGVASAGFHLLHISGVLNRLCTYARSERLSEKQLMYLKEEGIEQNLSVQTLLTKVEEAIEQTLKQLQATDAESLTELRTVGRKALPSTVQGLLFHAAEHTMRHVGQLLVTIKIVKAST